MPDFTIEVLGPCSISSPIPLSTKAGDKIPNFVPDASLIRYRIAAVAGENAAVDRKELLEVAGPREKIYFSPSHVHAGIVTCGGLCPGLNDVIRSIVRSLWFLYGVRRITGIQYGYKGFLPDYGYDVVHLDPDVVDDIHKIGGTLLGTSRGGG